MMIYGLIAFLRLDSIAIHAPYGHLETMAALKINDNCSLAYARPPGRVESIPEECAECASGADGECVYFIFSAYPELEADDIRHAVLMADIVGVATVKSHAWCGDFTGLPEMCGLRDVVIEWVSVLHE